MGRISRSRESVGKFVKSSPLERPKNRYRSFSFWNLSFNDGSRLWRQAPSVTEGQKGANKFSKVCIVPYIYIYISTVLSSATGKILVNLPGVSYFAYLQLEFLAFQRSTRNQNHPSRFIIAHQLSGRIGKIGGNFVRSDF